MGIDSIALVRIDPAQVRIRVAYDPQAPKKLSEWVNVLHPLVAINGGFFESDYRATALTIADGVTSGASYQGFGGMLTVNSDGRAELISLIDHSGYPGKDILQAIQSFPRLVWDGEVIPELDNEQRARRTAVAIDDTGHLLLIVSEMPMWTLAELGQWLADSDLGIVRALNLDGGPSTGLAIQAPGSTVLLDSQGPLPQVLMFEEKES
ncbi:phosphodiester glycosidase family protein [Leptolyngbya sp. FACHB-8]|nr:phosphodiester glycosidase family protein [Leptolyngbya sp. FACHB-8]